MYFIRIIVSTMSTQAIIDAMNKSDNLKSIAATCGIDKDEFKSKLIHLIQMNESMFEEEELEVKIDPEDDQFDVIVKQSGIRFTEEQIDFMNLAVNHRCNLALLSPAGYGKSIIIETTMRLFNNLIKPYPAEWFTKRYGPRCEVEFYQQLPVVGLCASTGKAASLIKGKTIHSYLGIGMGRGTVDDWVKRINSRSKKLIYSTLRAVQTIIVDEISMISAKMLDDISEYLKQIRNSGDPFGGVQMIFVGDFAQLPPVNGAFAFTSKEYKLANMKLFKLTKCFRQTDQAFLNILSNMRNGECPPEDYKILKGCTSIDESFSRGLKPMRLLSTNAEVDKINAEELERSCKENNTEVITFNIRSISDPKKAEVCRKAEMIPEEVSITIGAQIVVTYNLPNGAVNGTQGKVLTINQSSVVIESHEGEIYTIEYIACKDPEEHDSFDATVLFKYMPLRLGWACTIHKSQGCTFALLEVDLSRAFAHGQAYVAISRVKSLDGLIVKGLKRSAFKCNSIVKEFMNTV